MRKAVVLLLSLSLILICGAFSADASDMAMSTTQAVLNLNSTLSLKAVTGDCVIRWESSDPAIASVSPYGVVTSHVPGHATITATSTKTGESARCEITVRSMREAEYLNTRLEFPNGDEISSLLSALNQCGYKSNLMSFYGLLKHGSLPYLDEKTKLRLAGNPWNSFVGEPTSSGYGCYVTCLIDALRAVAQDNGINFSFGYSPDGNGSPDMTSDDEYLFVDESAFSSLAENAVNDGDYLVFWGTHSRNGDVMGTSESSLIWFTEDEKISFTSVSNADVLLLTGYDDDFYYFNDPIYGKDKRAARDSVEEAYGSLYCQYIRLIPGTNEKPSHLLVRDNYALMPPDTVTHVKLISGENAVYESTDEYVVTVGDDGLITTINPGEATVKVTSSGYTAYIRIIVRW